jgi:hypothetical protein
MQPQVIQQPQGGGFNPWGLLGLVGNVLLQNWPAVVSQGASILSGSPAVGSVAGPIAGKIMSGNSSASEASDSVVAPVEVPPVPEVGDQSQQQAPEQAPQAPMGFGQVPGMAPWSAGDIYSFLMSNPEIMNFLRQQQQQPQLVHPFVTNPMFNGGK